MRHTRPVRLGTLAGALIALLLFCALPAVAWGQNVDAEVDDNQTNVIVDGGDSSDNNVEGENNAAIDSGDNSQNAIQQCIAGGNCNQQINQQQTFNETVVEEAAAAPAAAPAGPAPAPEPAPVVRPTVVEEAPAPAPVAVEEVALAETGLDAWLLLLLGLGAIGGGTALLVAQRRGGLRSVLRR